MKTNEYKWKQIQIQIEKERLQSRKVHKPEQGEEVGWCISYYWKLETRPRAFELWTGLNLYS